MDRDMAEHLARDTGLSVEEITDDLTPVGADDVARHLAADTGVDEEEVSAAGADAMASMISRPPID